MPEIAEVARVVHFLRLHLVGKKIKKVSAQDDTNVFGKVGTTGGAVAAALNGRKVVSAGSQGKYFWLVLDKSPHLVMHLGMTGWVHIRGEKTAYTNYYKKMKPEEQDQWPPRFWKFHLETDSKPRVEVAFVDARRFGRVRLVECLGDAIRKTSPLVENGPDPVVDVDIFTEEFLRTKMRKRHVPVKALLLDQAFISGIGNWVGDEVLYQAKLHPEQYCDDFDDVQIKTLYDAIRYVCQTAVDKLGDSDEFPEDWLFNHRWVKGAKGTVAKLPNGDKLAFLTVGGRTSCYAPGVQRKSGRIAPGVKEEPVVVKGEEPTKSEQVKLAKPPTKRKRGGDNTESLEEKTRPTKKATPSTKAKPSPKTQEEEPGKLEDGNRRRSGRLNK